VSSFYLRSRRFPLACLVLLASFALTACGGGSGGGPNNGSGSSQTSTLNIGNPAANPGVIPPAASHTPVTFISVVSGTAAPDHLSLDEVDSAGNVLARNVAYLKDNGDGADNYRGDRVYTGTVMVGSVNSVEKHYRVHGDNDGQAVVSGTGKLWVSGCPVRARPSNPQLAAYDGRTDAFIFSNEVMVTVQDGVAPVLENINSVAAEVTGRVVGCIPSFNQYLFEIEGDGTAEGVYAAIDTLLSNPQVSSATPNAQVIELPSSETATCTGRECQWYLDRIRAPQAWAIAGAGDEQQGVAVIDFGIDCNHQELDCDGSVYNQDYIDHGTGVASLIGGNNQDNTDFTGVAWNTFLYPYSFLGRNGSQYKMSELITLSLGEDNVKVINISATTPIDPNHQIRDAVCGAIASGRLVVAAAGNATTAQSCQLSNTFPAQYNNLGQCTNGADLQAGLLVVGATDINNDLAQWDNDTHCSNTLYVDMFAPGKDIYTASVTDNYASKNGTSYAAPLVAGSAAILWSAHPELTVSQVHNQLVSASSQLSGQATAARAQTSDTRVDGRPLLNMYRALGGDDTVDTPDTTPDPFGFTDQTDAPFSELIASNAITISGLDTSAPIDVIGGYYSIDDGPFTNAASTITNGQQLRLQVFNTAEPTTSREVQVTVGGEIITFTVTTETPDTRPDNFDFLDSNNAPLNTVVTSNTLTIPGINTDTPISIVNGEYAIDGGAFTTVPGLVNGTQSIKLRVTSAGLPETVVTAVVTIGGIEDSFSVTTESADVSPDPFSLGGIGNVPLGSQQQSATISVNGINTPAPVSISAGEYSVDGAAFTSESSVVASGQTLQVRQTSANRPEATTYTTLTVGTFSSTFAVSTLVADITPDSFAFVDQTDVVLGSVVTSNAITVSGVNAAIPISISNGEYRINGGAFTNTAGQVSNGDTVEVRLTASTVDSTTVEATLSLGGINDTFSVSTAGANLPNSFTFTDQTNVAPGAQIESNTVTITGLTAPVDISVTGGEYRLDGGTYTTASGTVANNQTVQVRQTSSASLSTTTNLTLSIGGVSDTFSVTTLAADSVPDAFSFVDQTGISVSTSVISNPIIVSGINAPTSIAIINGAYSINRGAFVSASGTVNNGDEVRVRVTSSDTVETSVYATLSIGGISDIFSVSTIAADTTPDAFTFVDQTGVSVSTAITSNTVVVSGINTSASIAITNGTYSINNGAFASASGTVSNGDEVRVRVTSSDAVETGVDATLFIGGVSDTFSVSTIAADTTPNAFSFLDQTGVPVNTPITSNIIVVSGINSPAAITVTNGAYSINSGAFDTASSTVNNGDEIRVQVTSAASVETSVDATLTIGGVSDIFSVSTTLADTTPNAFTFVDQTGVSVGTNISSNTITITGINTATPISISGGEYAIDGGTFTNTASTINAGQTVLLRQTSSASHSTTTDAILTVGNVSDTFSVTTLASDTTPDSFSFIDQTNVAFGAVVISNAITVNGINTATPISINNGEYRINGGAFTNSAGQVSNGDTVEIRLTASTTGSTTVEATLTVGGISDIFSVSTVGDNVPDSFAFVDQTDVSTDALIESNIVTITGLTVPVAISVTGGEYRLDGGTYTSADGTVSNDQTVQVRQTASTNFSTTTDTTLSISGVSDTFSVTTLAADTAPDAFVFVDQTDVMVSTSVISNTITVSGINSPAAIAITNGAYSINSGAFDTASGTVNNGDTVRVRVTSSDAVETSVDATLSIGGVSDTFTVSTIPADTTPDAFNFTDQTGVAVSTAITSNAITVSGINSPAAITVTNGAYSINSGAFDTASGTVNNGDTVRVRVTSSDAVETSVDAILSIGGVTDTFSVSTIAADTTPNAFSFTDQTGVAVSTVISTNTITISGINTATPISISGGEYAINGGTFRSTASTISTGQTVQVRQTSSASFSTTTNAALTVGSMSDTFSVTTLPADTTPDDFTFTDQTGVAVNTSITSNAITVSGINSPSVITVTNGAYSINSGAFDTASGTVNNGDTVRVRVISSNTVETSVDATLSIGGVTDTFSVSTIAADTTPDAFSFTDQTGVAVSTVISSNTITISGINTATPISISDGEYAINGGTFRSTASTISTGQTVQVRQTSSASFSTTTNAALTVGSMSDTFSVTTLPADTTPDAFTFTDQTGVAVSTSITSNAITVSGINSPAAITVTNGAYSINSGAFDTASGTVNNGDTVRVRVTSSAAVETSVDATLSIGGVTDIFRVSTIAADTTPDAFSFTDQTGVAVSTVISSNTITISGINTATPISISGGEYAINGGTFRSTASTISTGQTVQVRQTSSASFSTTTNTALTVGSMSDTFSVTTLPADTTPDAFTFTDQTGVGVSTPITSNAITVSGINSPATIDITNGAYSINSGSFVTTSGTVNNGDQVRVQVTSSDTVETSVNATLYIGGVSDVFSVTTLATPVLQALNDTGIIWGGNYPTGNNTGCIGETIDEQDCKNGRDAQAIAGTLNKVGAGHAGFDFTKLDASGNTLAATANSWSCVRDNVTGLVWEVKTLAGSGGIHDADNTYRWGGKTARLTGTFGTLYNDWDTLVDGSNNETLCGFSDWRVPSRKELEGLVNFNQGNPAIDSDNFPNTASSAFWSSSPDAWSEYDAWSVDFNNGYSNSSSRTSARRVRLVRGGQ
jgi:hypothetical protein